MPISRRQVLFRFRSACGQDCSEEKSNKKKNQRRAKSRQGTTPEIAKRRGKPPPLQCTSQDDLELEPDRRACVERRLEAEWLGVVRADDARAAVKVLVLTRLVLRVEQVECVEGELQRVLFLQLHRVVHVPVELHCVREPALGAATADRDFAR